MKGIRQSEPGFICIHSELWSAVVLAKISMSSYGRSLTSSRGLVAYPHPYNDTNSKHRRCVIILALLNRGWGWSWFHILATCSSLICLVRSLLKFRSIAEINLTSKVILDHCPCLCLHVCCDSSKVSTKMANILDKTLLLRYGPIARYALYCRRALPSS